MAEIIEGSLQSSGLKFAIIIARFNDFVANHLLDGAKDALRRTGSAEKDVKIIRVPGSFEIPVVASRLAGSGEYDAIICLGAILRGETPHFDYIAAEAAKGIAHVTLQTGVPVAFGIITADTMDQAMDRAGAKSGNKGFDAAMTAIEMASLFKKLGGKPSRS
jgi:6,7-dimethyl-8-ribityllumazine synthase